MYPFAGPESFVRDAWYVAARSADIGEAIIAQTILGTPLILWRDAQGDVTCLEGSCSHRHYPLARAWKEGDQIRCPYHGLRFAHDGRCTQIPGQEEIPPNASLRRYPVVEQWAWTWVWMGDPSRADPALIPGSDQTWLSPDRGAFVAEPLAIHCRYALMTENLLDLSHIPYLHQKGRGTGWAAGNEWPEERSETDPDGRWMRGTRRFALPQPDLPPGCGLTGACLLTAELTYYPPVFFIARLRYEAEGQAAAPELHNIHAFTPVDAHRTLYHFGSGRNFATGSGEVSEGFRKRFAQVLLEDKEAAEMIEAMVDRPDRRPDFVTRADRGALQARRHLQRMINAQA